MHTFQPPDSLSLPLPPSFEVFLSDRCCHETLFRCLYCFTMHFNSLNLIYQLMHFYIQSYISPKCQY
jgi:hypothetical protein